VRSITAIASVVVLLSLVVTNAAEAVPQTPPAPQLTGPRLVSALLPPSVFGVDFTVNESLSTGRKLLPAGPATKLRSLTCGSFEANINLSAYGNTAAAAVWYHDLNSSAYTVDGIEFVYQFASAGTASGFIKQAYARWASCASYTFSSLDSPVFYYAFVGYPAQVTLTSQRWALIDGYHAFTAVDLVQGTFYFGAVWVSARTNVYEVWEDFGNGSAPSSALAGILIRRVQALYSKN